MTPDEASVYFDETVNAKAMCDLLERNHPGWTVWRHAHMWHARYKTWPGHKIISDTNAGLLSQAMRMGGVAADG